MQLIFFYILAVVAVISALGVIFNRNLVHSALALLVNFCTVAIFYFMLNAQFLGVVQILVYAGAVIVLFLFVVMLLGADLGEQVTNWVTPQTLLAVGLSMILLTVVGSSVFEYPVQGAHGDLTMVAVQQYGQVQLIGAALFTDYLLSFELAGVLLLVGIVGVIWLGRLVPQKVKETKQV